MQNDYITGRRISVVEMNEDTKDDENIYAIALAIGGSLSDKGKATIIFEREDGTIGERPITACRFLEKYTNDDFMEEFAKQLWYTPCPGISNVK